MRSTLVRWFPALLVPALAAAATAQSFDYPDFSSTAGLVLNAGAQQAGSALRVSSAVSMDVGSAWYATPVQVGAGFVTTFEFQITSPVSGGADGLAFVIHNDPDGQAAIGANGGALGYGYSPTAPTAATIENSLAIEIDTYLNGNFKDPDGNHISVHTGSVKNNTPDEDFSIGRATAPVDLSDGAVHELRVVHAQGQLEIFLDGSATPLISVAWDFATGGTLLNTGSPIGGLNLIGGTNAYVGFTAASGGAFENHDVLSWRWYSGIIETFCTAKSGLACGLPMIEYSGFASATASSGFVVSAGPARSCKSGILLYNTTAGTALPFQGGTLCVAPAQLKRAGATNSMGTPGGCDGLFAIDMNTFAQGAWAVPDCAGAPTGAPPNTPAGFLKTPGQEVYCQYWGRDSVATGSFLSDALHYSIGP